MQVPSDPINLPEVNDTLKRFDPEPLYQTIYETTRFLVKENPSLLQGLKSIWLYDTIVDDYYQNNLIIGSDGPGLPFCGFREEWDPEVCPSIHLYIFEILGGAIEGRYATGLWGRWVKRLDGIWFKRFGQYFLVWKLIWAIVIHNDDFYQLGLSEEDKQDRIQDLYNAYLDDQGITISNTIYKAFSCIRIWKANRRMKKWCKHLESLNPTRKAFIEAKRQEYESQQEKE